VRSEYDFPGCTILEVVITGTHKGDFVGVRPLGNAVRIAMAAFYTFDETSEKLISERIYFDQGNSSPADAAKINTRIGGSAEPSKTRFLCNSGRGEVLESL